ncbi:MAG: hypothetical protein U5L45_25535 [Saprospiraceae bacterium]|nr:hypothetical protein [Saprospiraceae bacterium]
MGDNHVAYGDKRLREVDWRARLMEEVAPDPSRVHFTGGAAAGEIHRGLRRSDAHVYLTAPFVLCMVDARSAGIGCLLVASDTDPVREFATDGETALLTGFFDHDRLAARLTEALEDRAMGARHRAPRRRRASSRPSPPPSCGGASSSCWRRRWADGPLKNIHQTKRDQKVC